MQLHRLLSMTSTTPRLFPDKGLVHFNTMGLLPSPSFHLGSTWPKIKGNLWPLPSLVQLYIESKQPQKLTWANTITTMSILCRIFKRANTMHCNPAYKLPSAVQFQRQNAPVAQDHSAKHTRQSDLCLFSDQELPG